MREEGSSSHKAHTQQHSSKGVQRGRQGGVSKSLRSPRRHLSGQLAFLRPRHSRLCSPLSSYPPWPDFSLLQCSIKTALQGLTAWVSCCFKYSFTALWSTASLMNRALPSAHCRAIAQPVTKLSVITGTGKLNRAALKALWTCPTTKHNLGLYSTITWEQESGEPTFRQRALVKCHTH